MRWLAGCHMQCSAADGAAYPSISILLVGLQGARSKARVGGVHSYLVVDLYSNQRAEADSRTKEI